MWLVLVWIPKNIENVYVVVEVFENIASTLGNRYYIGLKSQLIKIKSPFIFRV